MDAFAFLVVLIVVVLVLLSRVYRGSRGPAEEEDRAVARLSAVLDADVMAALSEAARRTGQKEVRIVNDRLRASLQDFAPKEPS